MAVNNLVSSVAFNLSTDITAKYAGTNVEEIVLHVGKAVVEHRAGLNLDMRWSARGVQDPEIVQYEVLAQIDKSSDYSCYIKSNLALEFMNMRDSDKSNMLILSVLSLVQEFPFLAADPSIKLNLLNDEYLYIYENFIRDEYEATRDRTYNVFEVSDLGEEMDDEDKFSYISVTASNVVGNDNFLKKLVGSLKPNGLLCIRNASDSRKLYAADFMSHPYYNMHKILLESDGDTVHDSGLMGRLVFRKSA